MDSDPTKIELLTDPLTQHMSGYTNHGNHYFDVPFISQIEGNLWQGGCETGLVLPEFIEHLVSLYPWEQYTVKHHLKSTHTFRMYDGYDVDGVIIDAAANLINALIQDGVTLVHCQAGLNRSSFVAARALMLQGMSGKEAIKLIRANRSPVCLCNVTFEQWLLTH